MHDSISTAGPQRPRVRRGLGLFVGVALLATPMAMAPAASAAGGLGNVTAPGLAAVLSQLAEYIAQIASGLASQTLPHPLGEKAPNSTETCGPNYADGLSSTLTCIIARLDGGGQAKAKIKASRSHGKITSLRWTK